MKKSVLLLASALLIVSCNVPEGGNKSRIFVDGDVVRYDDPNAVPGTYKAETDSTKPAPVLTSEVAAPEAAVKVDSTQAK